MALKMFENWKIGFGEVPLCIEENMRLVLKV
jgi:hypothetical protein